MKRTNSGLTPAARPEPVAADSATDTDVGEPTAAPSTTAPRYRCNTLDGKRWLQNSISVWSDLRKTREELALKHPAAFPAQLVTRLMESLLPAGPRTVLDPFAGMGTTLLAAAAQGHRAIGCELSADYVARTRQRIADAGYAPELITLHQGSWTQLGDMVPAGSVDLCVTSPPYWNILHQKRTADSKAIRHYGGHDGDLSLIADYEEFLAALGTGFRTVFELLKPGCHACVVIMDLRKKQQFFPFHSDLARQLQQVGFVWDDLIVWNRQSEYNNLRPLGYPSVFRINKVHEFVLLMQKPRG